VQVVVEHKIIVEEVVQVVLEQQLLFLLPMEIIQ
jgi:hypothetical protein